MPPMRLGRDAVLQCLDAVYPGISPKNIIEQSGSFVFRKGRVYTFNDETACVIKSPFPKDFTAAVPAGAFLDILRKLPEDELEFDFTGSELLLRGKRKTTGVAADATIVLPIDSLEKPDKWVSLHRHFGDAVGVVQECASKDGTMFTMTCIHVHPKWVEACDDHQIARYRLTTGVTTPTIVKKESLKHVATLDMTELGETPNWLHFRNPAGMVLSCRRYTEPYQDMTKPLDVKGAVRATLPKGLMEAAERAEIFSKELVDDNELYVEIRQGYVTLKGTGASGWHQEKKKMGAYSGPDFSFYIGPKMLKEIVTNHNDVLITQDRIKVEGGRFVYVSALRRPDAKAGGDKE